MSFIVKILLCCIVSSLAEEYPDPRIVIVGPTGAGKSSIAEALLGCDPTDDSDVCMFEVCNGLDSCTKNTTAGTGQWLGNGEKFTVVDTPGFGDSDGNDNQYIEEMMNVLDNKLGYANTILLVLQGSVPRFSNSLYAMLRQMTSIFGETWWDFMMVAVSKWSYSQGEIDKRNMTCNLMPENCKDEAWFRNEFNAQFQEKFGINKTFTFAFIDSWSQSPVGINDPVQQKHWIEETNKLWKNSQNGNFEFQTIDDVLEENAACKKENAACQEENAACQNENADCQEENDNLLKTIEDLEKELTDIHSSEIIGLHILTGDVTNAGCDKCNIYAFITGPENNCYQYTKLDNSADNFRRGAADVFEGNELHECKSKNLGDVRMEDKWRIQFIHERSGGWYVESAWLIFKSGMSMKCYFNEWLDGDEYVDSKYCRIAM